ncbi:hypothetical protein GQ457_08G000890 [Hibiscus cannabinus]
MLRVEHMLILDLQGLPGVRSSCHTKRYVVESMTMLSEPVRSLMLLLYYLLDSALSLTDVIIRSDTQQDTLTTNRTSDLTTSLEVGPATSHAAGDSPGQSTRSMLTIAFQFPFDSNLMDNVRSMARQYVGSVVSSVQRVVMAISPSGLSPTIVVPKRSPDGLVLAYWISQSYRQVALENNSSCHVSSSMPQVMLLFSPLQLVPVFIFANQVGLDMLETTLVALQDKSLDARHCASISTLFCFYETSVRLKMYILF